MTEQHTTSEARRTLDSVWGVVAFGADPTQKQWSSILTWTEPLIERDWLDGATSRKTAAMILSLAMSALGDAYRELGRPLDSARA